MARHRDHFYNEDDVPQSIDGFGTTHAEFTADRLAEPTDYWVFFGIQSGRQTGAAAVPKVWYSTAASYYYEHDQDCANGSYMSFAFMYEIETDWVGSTELSFQIYA